MFYCRSWLAKLKLQNDTRKLHARSRTAKHANLAVDSFFRLSPFFGKFHRTCRTLAYATVPCLILARNHPDRYELMIMPWHNCPAVPFLVCMCNCMCFCLYYRLHVIVFNFAKFRLCFGSVNSLFFSYSLHILFLRVQI